MLSERADGNLYAHPGPKSQNGFLLFSIVTFTLFGSPRIYLCILEAVFRKAFSYCRCRLICSEDALAYPHELLSSLLQFHSDALLWLRH